MSSFSFVHIIHLSFTSVSLAVGANAHRTRDGKTLGEGTAGGAAARRCSRCREPIHQNVTRQGRSLELVPAFVCLRLSATGDTWPPKIPQTKFNWLWNGKSEDLHIRKIVVLPSIAQFNYLIPIVSFCNEMHFIRGKMSPDEKVLFFLFLFPCWNCCCWLPLLVLMFRRPGSLRECVSRRTSPSRHAAVFPCYTMDIYVDK